MVSFTQSSLSPLSENPSTRLPSGKPVDTPGCVTYLTYRAMAVLDPVKVIITNFPYPEVRTKQLLV